MISAGAHDLTRKDKEVTLSAIYKTHPDYTLNKLRGILVNDFALLKLSRSIDFTSHPHIRPICLPPAGFEDYDHVSGTVTGWGNTEVEFFQRGDYVRGYGSAVSDTLQKLDMRSVHSYPTIVNQHLFSGLCAKTPVTIFTMIRR